MTIAPNRIKTSVRVCVFKLSSGYFDHDDKISIDDNTSCASTVSLREDDEDSFTVVSSMAAKVSKVSLETDDNSISVKAIMDELSESEKEAAACSSYTYYRMTTKNSSASTFMGLPEVRNLAASSMVARYLRAEKGNVASALTKLRATLQWRKEQRLDTLRDCFELNTPEALTFRKQIQGFVGSKGKLVISGYDKEHRACWHTIGRHSPEGTQADHEGCMIAHYYMLERALACSEARSLKYGSQIQDTVIVSVDFGGFKQPHAPLLSTVKQLLIGLRDHYPERLFRVYLVDPPLVFRGLWRMVQPFVDEHTKTKFKFVTGSSIQRSKVFEEALGRSQCMPYQHAQGELSGTVNMNEFFCLPFNKALGEDQFDYAH